MLLVLYSRLDRKRQYNTIFKGKVQYKLARSNFVVVVVVVKMIGIKWVNDNIKLFLHNYYKYELYVFDKVYLNDFKIIKVLLLNLNYNFIGLIFYSVKD